MNYARRTWGDGGQLNVGRQYYAGRMWVRANVIGGRRPVRCAYVAVSADLGQTWPKMAGQYDTPSPARRAAR